MRRRSARWLGTLLAAAVAAGCSGWRAGGDAVPGSGDGLAGFKECFAANGIESIDELETIDAARLRFDGFMDCYVGPRLAAGMAADLGVRLLRGHVVATALARYAAFNLTGEVGERRNLDFRSYPAMRDHASEMVVAIGRAERGYRTDSGLFTDLVRSPHAADFLPRVKAALDDVSRLDHALAVLSAAREAAAPTRERGRQVFAGLIGTFATPTASGVRAALTDLKTGIRKLAVLDTFGRAYRLDVADYLSCVQERERPGSTHPAHPPPAICGADFRTDWQAWDGLLQEACDRLARVGDVENVCLPGRYR